MLVSELLRSRVVTKEGQSLGRVHDLVFEVPEFPIKGGAPMTLVGLVVGRKEIPWRAVTRTGTGRLQVDPAQIEEAR